jgi:endonuclease YncB( thermonuclease family)
MKPLKRSAVLLAFVLLLGAKAEVLTGEVTDIIDGDTITMVHSGKPIGIRLFGVDTPEPGQDYGGRASEFTHALALNETVVLEIMGEDDYGRLVAEVKFKDGRSLNAELLRAGLAWWYEKYAHDRKDFEALQKTAKESQIGLWNDEAPVPPWEYREWPFCASKKSKVYHPCDCPTWTDRVVRPENMIRFKTEEDAQKSGKRHCKCPKKK